MPTLTQKIQKHIDETVLCWLATVDTTGVPNVSPKELFTYHQTEELVIAHIASPQSVKNIRSNPKVCVSWVDVFTQKGYKAKGIAQLISSKDIAFTEKAIKLQKMAGESFPFHQLISVKIESIEEIIAPSYRFYPNTTEESQITAALQAYRVQEYLNQRVK